MTLESRVLSRLPPYPFAALEEKARAVSGGEPLLGFAIGDPDLPPPRALVEAALAAMESPEGNRYSSSRGESDLRTAFAEWFAKRFHVSVDPATEVCVLVGSKEGLAAFPRAILDPGARVAVPDPGYPAYANAVRLGRMRPVALPLSESRGWLPEWDRLPPATRLLYLNYPNNPTGAVVRLADIAPAIDRARDQGFTIAYDNAYSEITFGREPAPSILEHPAAREVAVEFHSLSKTLGIPGWRIGFAVGNAERIRALVSLKSHSDSGAPNPLQRAAARILRSYDANGWPAEVRAGIAQYAERLQRLAAGLTSAGLEVGAPSGTLYLWQRAPIRDGAKYAARLLERHHLLVTPGGAFGRGGRSFVRWSVTAPMSAIDAAISRIGSARARRA